MHALPVSLVAAFALSCSASPPASPDADATIQELKAQVAALKAQGNEDRFVVRRATEVVAGMPLDEAEMEDAPYAGLRLSDLAPETAAQLPIMPGSGLLVADAVADGPAAAAGLRSMDVIARVGDQVVVNADQFRVLVRARKRGEAMPVTVYRGGKELAMSITLGTRRQPKLGPGGRIAGAGFETDGNVFVMRDLDGLGGLPHGMLAPPAKVMTMRGPNGGMTVMVNADAQPGQALLAPPAVAGTAGAAANATAGPAAGGAATSVSKSVYTDEHAEIAWTTTDGTDEVVITDRATGKVVWRGAGAPDAAAIGSFGPEVQASVQHMLEGRRAAERLRARPVAPMPPASPARPRPGEASQPADA